MYPRILPRAGKDVIHIQTGRRVVTVPLPARGPAGCDENYERVAFIATEMRRRAIAARGADVTAQLETTRKLIRRIPKAARAPRAGKKR